MEYLWNLISPPLSPIRQGSSYDPTDPGDPGDQLVAALVTDTLGEATVTNENYVEFDNGEKKYFDHIVGCTVSITGDIHFSLSWTDVVADLNLILNDTFVPAEKLCHCDAAVAWTIRFDNWAEQIRHQIPFDTLLFWDDMKCIFTADATLTSWLELRGLSFLQPLLEKHGCVSLDMLSYLDRETMLQWGMKSLPARLIMEDIQAMKH